MIEKEQLYKLMFSEYPDIVTSDQASKMLKTSKKNLYNLIKTKQIGGLKIGKGYKIPKLLIIDYIINKQESENILNHDIKDINKEDIDKKDVIN